ncbi:MAG: hypothetical protein DWI00_05500 [Planctomycetota bacterium]|nr:MAG: hypothetical protein DWI00_05500 [Planctomycetota bacterium]
MDLSRLLQMLQEEREGQSGLRPISLLRALKQMISQGSRTRRNSGVQALDRPESLEVRQVLSAVSPVDNLAPLIAVEESFIDDDSVNQGLVAVDQADTLLPTNAVPSNLLPDGHVVQMVREQLSKSLSQSNLNPEMSIPEWIVQIPDKSSTNRGQPGDEVLSGNALINGIEVSSPEMISTGMSDPFFSTPSDQLNLSIVLEYSDGPQEVTVESISSTSLQIKVSGLAGTIYEASGAEYTAQVLFQNAMEVLQRVQPTRPVQILFPSSTLGGRDRIPTFPGASIGDRLHTVPGTGLSPGVSETGVDVQGPLSNSRGQDSGAKVSSDETSIDSSLIDEVFSVSDLALETSILVKSGISRLQQNLAWPQADSSPTILRQHEENSVRSVELRHDQESAPSTTVASSAQGGLVRLVRRGLSWLRPGRLPAASLVSGSVASEFIVGVVAELAIRPETKPISQNSPAEGVEWLSWLLRHSSKTNQQNGIGNDNSIHHGELTPGQVPVFSDSVGSSRDVRGAYSPQAQIRKYREQHRHAGGLNGAICIALYEHDSSRVPRSTSIPRELKYVANPRGPPVYGRDADVPLLEVDAPADLLERLRYSIAPRGPSLATVETQSPDFTFSSGPSMSPEKVSTDLAI